jgi:hypothetical protein
MLDETVAANGTDNQMDVMEYARAKVSPTSTSGVEAAVSRKKR